MPALLALAAGPAGAQVVCTASAQTVAFGAYDTRSPAPRDSTGNIAITCRGLTGQSASYAIALSAGLAGSVAKRTLRSASGALAYNLYVDAARTRVWGDGVAGSVTLTDAYTLGALAVTRNYPVYGRLPGSQNVPVGFYTDTITVTVSF